MYVHGRYMDAQGESKLRQIFVSNASSLGALCFVMIQLVPVPILFYADSIQHRQHHRLYTYLGRHRRTEFCRKRASAHHRNRRLYRNASGRTVYPCRCAAHNICKSCEIHGMPAKARRIACCCLACSWRSSAYSLNPFLSIMSYSSPDCSSARACSSCSSSTSSAP